MNNKEQLLKMLREELGRWEKLLAGLSEAQLTAGQLADNYSIKDVLAHLRAWQQRSVARMEAAVADKEPIFPQWPEDLDLNSEADLDRINDWIYQENRETPWAAVYAGWRDNYLRFVELIEQVPEKDLLAPGRYSWLGDYPLALIVESSYEHHHEEHRGPLLAWLGQEKA